jgi:uncharacterized membrane protein
MADLASVEQELQRLRALIADLTGRVYRLEGAVKVERLREANRPEIPAPERVRVDVPAQNMPRPSPTGAGMEVSTPVHAAAIPRHGREVQQDDLESRIGSHWLNRVGIAAVLIGVSYFLKYAFDNNWIGATGRVTIGLVIGIGIVLWSERFRTRGYPIFSFSLKAVGIGVLYLSLWAAFQVYRLIPGGAAFVAMIAVTGVTVMLAIAQDAEILAAIALIGGFLTPVLLSTGQNHERALFSYVVLLDFAALALVRFKPWGRLLAMNFAGTLILYAGWYSAYYRRDELRLTFGFATLFFAIFAIAPLFAQSGAEADGILAKIPYAIALLNPATYFLQIYTMLEEVDKNVSAWVALALAGVYVYLSREIGRRSRIAGMDLLHLALAVGFITIAIPIRLDAHWITVGWFVEAAVLLWVGDRIHSEFLNFFALAALVLAVVRLLLIDNFYSERLIFNSRIAIHAVAIIVLGLVAWFGSRRQDERGLVVAGWALVGLNVLALVALSRDVADYYSHRMSALQLGVVGGSRGDWVHYHNLRIARDFTFSALWMAYGAMLMVIGFWRRSALARWQALVLIAITIIKVFVYDVSQLDFGYRILSFIVLGVLLLAISFGYQRDWLKLSGAGSQIRGGLPPA